jgi:hypothetical protein
MANAHYEYIWKQRKGFRQRLSELIMHLLELDSYMFQWSMEKFENLVAEIQEIRRLAWDVFCYVNVYDTPEPDLNELIHQFSRSVEFYASEIFVFKEDGVLMYEKMRSDEHS